MMESLSDYLIESPSSSRTIKAKHKSSSTLYNLEIVPWASLAENEQKTLLAKMKTRCEQSCHPNILHFHGYFFQDNVVYIKQEFYEHGSLSEFILRECVGKQRALREEFLCRIMYQIAFALKTVECFMGQLNLDSVLLDADYNVKLLNFYCFNGETRSHKQKEIKMSHLGALMFELFTLKKFDKSCYELMNSYHQYSAPLKDLLTVIIKDSSEIKKHINKVLTHPMVLLKSTQWNKDQCFMDTSAENYNQRLDKLRKKEASLQLKEELLQEQERKLQNKEKKLRIMECTLKEKLQQAELYLKRCRETGRSVSSSSSKSSTKSQSHHKKMSYEELDATYATYDEPELFATSTKLQVHKIVKPQNFSRTLSERKIRFKTSPLKDMNFLRKSHSKKCLKQTKIEEEKNHQEDDNKENLKSESNRKSLLYENGDFVMESKPVWTQETKKYAFEILRMMNAGEKEINSDVKHTQL